MTLQNSIWHIAIALGALLPFNELFSQTSVRYLPNVIAIDSTIEVSIDSRHLTAGEAQSIYNSILRVRSLHTSDSHLVTTYVRKVHKNETLNTLMSKEYRLDAKTGSKDRDELTSAVARMNNITNPDSSYQGRNLIMLNMPVRSNSKASDDNIQRLNLFTGVANVVHIDDNFNISQKGKKTKAALWSLSIPEKDFPAFTSDINPDTLEKLITQKNLVITKKPNALVRAIFPVDTVKLSAFEGDIDLPVVDTELQNKISGIAPSNFGHFYIFDYFSDTCMHGDAVYGPSQSY